MAMFYFCTVRDFSRLSLPKHNFQHLAPPVEKGCGAVRCRAPSKPHGPPTSRMSRPASKSSAQNYQTRLITSASKQIFGLGTPHRTVVKSSDQNYQTRLITSASKKIVPARHPSPHGRSAGKIIGPLPVRPRETGNSHKIGGTNRYLWAQAI